MKKSILTVICFSLIAASAQAMPVCKVANNRLVVEIGQTQVPITAQQFQNMVVKGECSASANPQNCAIQVSHVDLGNYLRNHCRALNNYTFEYDYYSVKIAGVEVMATGTCYELACTFHQGEGSAIHENRNNLEYCSASPRPLAQTTLNILQERGFCR